MNRTAYQTQKIFFALGTVCTLTAFGSGALRALDRAKARITEIDRLVNTCDPKADIRDVFMGSDRLIRSLRDHGVEPEISVLAKGYAADEARRILIAENITEALIEIGDTVITVGSARRIGLQDPFAKAGTVYSFIDAADKAVASSGIYEQRPGADPASPLAGVTLIGDSAALLNALAVTVCTVSLPQAVALLHSMRVEAIFVTKAQEVFTTEGVCRNARAESRIAA